MISSKGIRILCYFVMGFVIFISLILLVFGLVSLFNEEKLGGVLIVLGLLLPLIVTVSLYPIFALATIEESLSSLNAKIEQIVSSTSNNDNEKDTQVPTSHPLWDKTDFEDATEYATKNNNDSYPTSYLSKTLGYINLKYEISISIDDEYEEMKEMVLNIENDSFQANALKNRIKDAKTKEEILAILNSHRLLYS